MTLKHELRMLLRKGGIDLSRYNAAQSLDARMQLRLKTQRIDTVLDVGANDGGYARALRAAGFEGRILSFEPLDDAHQRLCQQAEGQAGWAVAPRMALGASEGEVEINVAGNSASSSILPMLDRHLEAAPNSRYVSQQQVPLRRLDAVAHPLIEQARAIHLKIDTQGYEMPVLEGAAGLMPRIRGLQLEMSLVPLYEGQVLFRELYDWVIGQGFELHGVVPGFMDVETGRMLQMDGIFFRPPAA
ncbi:FkbM family methyltransferase [Aquabacterium sp.]|uniref:FkbM family methyltransferase n=1 Tax=Aquabacterium sp. TaxID=1872578 RepID=UPI003783A4D7